MDDGRFELLDVLGAGAFALVCTAVDRPTGRTVALKVLRRDLRSDPEAVARLQDEGRILMRLDHPNVARCLELLTYEAQPVLVIELVEGASLDHVQRAVPRLPLGVAAAIGARVGRGVAHAWTAPGPDGRPMRVVHRDLKPNNVLLAQDGGVKVIDFGIARAAFDGRRAKSIFLVQGTAGFDAPERGDDGDDGPPVDVYGLGALVVALVVGSPPMIPRDPALRDKALERHLDRMPPEAAALVPVLRSALAGLASARPPMATLVEALEAVAVDEAGLAAFAAEVLPPLLVDEGFRGELSTEGWDELAFLEQDAPTQDESPLDRPQLEREVARFVAQPGWETRTVALEAVLRRGAPFAPAALLGVLDRASAAWWQPWVRPATAAELEAALVLLCDRATDDVIARARQLLEHAEPRVAAAARFVVNQGGRMRPSEVTR